MPKWEKIKFRGVEHFYYVEGNEIHFKETKESDYNPSKLRDDLYKMSIKRNRELVKLIIEGRLKYDK